MKKIFFSILFLFFSTSIFSQPYIDPVNFNSQIFRSTYEDSLHTRSLAVDYNMNIFLPKQYKNGNTFLFRLSGEELTLGKREPYSNVYAISMPIGFQFLSKNKKWKTLFMAIPKISSDLQEDLYRGNFSKNFQYGGTTLITYVFNDSFKVKLGLFYNKECFGNFFVPLLGIDWKASARWSVYGILPNNMKVEFKACKKFYCGIGFKNYKRSYRLTHLFNDDFVLAKETEVKLFFDFYTKLKIIFFADAAYSLKYDLAEYSNADPKVLGLSNPMYRPMENNFLFTVGIAYRIRTD